MQAPSLLTDFSPSREVQRQCVHDERVNILAIHQHSSVLRANSNTHDQSVSPPELCRFEPKLNSAKCPKTIALSFCESHLGTQWLVLNDFFSEKHVHPAGRPSRAGAPLRGTSNSSSGEYDSTLKYLDNSRLSETLPHIWSTLRTGRPEIHYNEKLVTQG